jgi:hypothetical protein
MKVGAEPKKIAMLGGLVLVGGYLFYANVLSQSSDGPPPALHDEKPASVAPVAATTAKSAKTSGVRRSSRARNSEDFRPSLKLPQGEDRPDPMSIDPTLRLDLLAKVQAVELQGGQRNLFQFGTAPPPPAPELKGPEPKVPIKSAAEIRKEIEKRKAEAKANPSVAPIHLKYYGYTSVRGESARKAFFLDGDDILVASEGDVVKKRYRVVRIGVNSVVMEDTHSKTQQTIRLLEEVAG